MRARVQINLRLANGLQRRAKVGVMLCSRVQGFKGRPWLRRRVPVRIRIMPQVKLRASFRVRLIGLDL